jgi:hypothetical protein
LLSLRLLNGNDFLAGWNLSTSNDWAFFFEREVFPFFLKGFFFDFAAALLRLLVLHVHNLLVLLLHRLLIHFEGVKVPGR